MGTIVSIRGFEPCAAGAVIFFAWPPSVCVDQVMGAAEISELPADKRRALEADLAIKLGALKNTAYTSGWKSARGAMMDSCKI